MSILRNNEDRSLQGGDQSAEKSAIRGRVCNRAGCGKLLLTPEGTPDYGRQFCGSKCRLADKRDRFRSKRRKLKGTKCPLCGRYPSSPAQPPEATACDGGVPRNTAPPSDAPREGVWGVLKVGYGPPSASQREIGTVARRVDLPRGTE